MNGLYGYWDNVKQKVVYIGQSKDVRGRLKAHMFKSQYDAQQINRVLQSNPDRYEPFIFVEGDYTKDELNELEYEAVEIFKTNRYKYPENEGFNFKDGGGVVEMPDETRKKISEANKGENNYFYGKHHSEESKKRMSDAKKGKYDGENHPRWKDYARIIKCGFNRGKQNYSISFNGNRKLRQSISIDKLVKWFNSNYPDEELVIDEGIKHQ